MYYGTNHSVLYSDTLVPDVFISEYLPNMDGYGLKVYLYTIYLSKHNKFATPWDISKKINITMDQVKDAIELLEHMGLATMSGKKLMLIDLKEKEINRLYRMKTTSLPTEMQENTARNKKRNETVYAINEKFFQGLMSPSWYTDIDHWFDQFKFDEDVMYTLFQHCYDNKGLFKNYIQKVAESWHAKSIRTGLDLDQYYLDYQKMRDVRGKISKKLKLGRMLTEYEEEFVEKWCAGYHYDFETIEIALKKTTGRTCPSFNYIDAIISDWNSRGLKSKQEILEHMKNNYGKEEKARKSFPKGDGQVPQHSNFEQREYGKDEFEKFYANLDK
jgi:DnaD/phage-associated family protein